LKEGKLQSVSWLYWLQIRVSHV